MKLGVESLELEVRAAGLRSGSGLHAEIDGKREEWPAIQETGAVRVLLAGRSMRFVVRRRGDEVWVAAGGDLLCVRRRDEGGGRALGEEAGSLTSPMPGRVLEVRVEPGDEVRKGDTLVLIEAMKMEVRIVAPRDGRVREVLYAEEERFAAGVPLVALEGT